MGSFLLLIFAQFIVQKSSGQSCVYHDSDSHQVLYLDALEHATLEVVATEALDDHTYTYTPCRNAAGTCPSSTGSGGQDTSMVKQTLESDPNICTVVANTDSSVSPTFDPDV